MLCVETCQSLPVWSQPLASCAGLCRSYARWVLLQVREHYEKQGLLHLVNAEQPADDVFADVCTVVAALQAEQQRQLAQAALAAEAAADAAVASGGTCAPPL